MKKLIIKLDDIGRETHRAIFDTVLWAMERKIPISIGTIGNDLRHIPSEVVDLIKVGIKLSFVEVWNHGFRHIRYDQHDQDAVMSDLHDGHQAICDVLSLEPAGFGFPFNKFTPELVTAIRNAYPKYFIYESDFPRFKLLSPEFNSLADGQPRFSYFMERVGSGSNVPQGIVLQAHPPRWTNTGFAEFSKCVEHLIEHHKFMCVKAVDEAVLQDYIGGKSAYLPPARLLPEKLGKLTNLWEQSADELNTSLSNFKSYFLPRFIADAEKNFFQVSRAIYPFRPKKILDIGSGLGNWSLPFLLGNECESLVLNDINATILQALNMATAIVDTQRSVVVEPRDLLKIPDTHGYRVDFLVCANTFNYLDPVDFFRFAQSATVPGARLLLMYQTGAFNKLRFRTAFNSKDPSVLAEVLASDLAMLMRRVLCLHPTQVRHVFSTEEISKLAIMFDFGVESRFIPSGESTEDDESVYECLILRRSTGMKAAILSREEWLAECKTSIDHSFGPRAFTAAGFPEYGATPPFSYFDDWHLPDSISTADANAIQSIKMGIAAIKLEKTSDLKALGAVDPKLKVVADKVIKASNLFRQGATASS